MAGSTGTWLEFLRAELAPGDRWSVKADRLEALLAQLEQADGITPPRVARAMEQARK